MTLVSDIWRSLGALPLPVQAWVFVILVPVNLVTLAFLSEPHGTLVATLAVGGLVLGSAIMFWCRGFSRLISLGHLVTWIPLVVFLALRTPAGGDGYSVFLVLLLVVNVISLFFDVSDMWRWWRGDRDVPGHAETHPKIVP
jgi:hypothetical protein